MSPQQPSRVEPKLWRCCAGHSVKIPKLHSRVYYFPQGHLEHACPNSPNTETLSLLDGHRPFHPCIVSAVDLLADPHTDEVFVKLLLTPITDGCVHEPTEVREDEHKGDEFVSSGKTLTLSDANNGGAFSVPRSCATSVFPPLDLQTKQPYQELSVTDVHGNVWEFRHVYRGTPLRHLITSNWSKFVDKKKLVCGDSLIFMKKKDSSGDIFVGIRRHTKFGAAAKVTKKSVMEAAELANKNIAFEVEYYPTVEGFCDFVVDAKVVEDSMKINWNCGIRIKFSLKNEDSSKRCSVFKGTISALSAPNRPWRMLEVNWDGPEVSHNPKQSPWEVELISYIPALNLQLPPTKRLRVAQGSTSLNNIERSSIPMIDFQYSPTKSLNQTLLNCDTFIDGVLRAQDNLFSTATTSNILNDKANGFIENNSMARLDIVSTEPNISTPIFGDSPLNHSILNPFETKFDGSHKYNTKEVNPGSFMLFGKMIHPVGSNLHDSAAKGEDGCKGCNN